MCGVHKLTEYFFLPFLQRPSSSKIRVLALNEFHFIIEVLLPATPVLYTIGLYAPFWNMNYSV